MISVLMAAKIADGCIATSEALAYISSLVQQALDTMQFGRSLPIAIPLLSLGVLSACAGSSTTEASAGEITADTIETSVEVTPISHATFVLTAGDVTVYNDPVGGVAAFSGMPPADVILVSDIHGDHLDTATLAGLLRDSTQTLPNTVLVVPAAVRAQLPPAVAARAQTMANGETAEVNGVTIEALPMYNLRAEALQYHTKGRGNGYVVTLAGERIYIAGDTEDIPEMRALEDIDRAFLPMNLPYTMPVEAAANATLAFAPKQVYPYHYRGTDGLSDVGAFAKTVTDGGDTEVVQLEWYPEE